MFRNARGNTHHCCRGYARRPALYSAKHLRGRKFGNAAPDWFLSVPTRLRAVKGRNVVDTSPSLHQQKSLLVLSTVVCFFSVCSIFRNLNQTNRTLSIAASLISPAICSSFVRPVLPFSPSATGFSPSPPSPPTEVDRGNHFTSQIDDSTSLKKRIVRKRRRDQLFPLNTKCDVNPLLNKGTLAHWEMSP